MSWLKQPEALQNLRVAVTATALVAAGCGTSGPTPDACDLCTTSAIVYGAVHDTSGIGVSGALVTVRVFSEDTARARDNLAVSSADNPVRTNATGAFRAQPITPLSPFRARVAVTVVPPTPFADTSADAAGPIQFRVDVRGPGRDSTRVDVIVRRRGP